MSTEKAGFVYSFDGVEYHADDEELTFEEAVSRGLKEVELEYGNKLQGKIVYIGKKYSVDLDINAEQILDELALLARDQAGDVADSFLEDVTERQEMDLEIRLNQVLHEWLQENNLNPKFYCVSEVVSIPVEMVKNQITH